MKSFGLALIVLGIVMIVLGLFGVGGGGYDIRSLTFAGVVMAVGGFLLYRRNRARELPRRG
jgi:hypothetical protein